MTLRDSRIQRWVLRQMTYLQSLAPSCPAAAILDIFRPQDRGDGSVRSAAGKIDTELFSNFSSAVHSLFAGRYPYYPDTAL
jgi:hypothetical protein